MVDVCGRASNQAGRYAAEDMVTGTFTFASGVHGVGAWCFSAFDRVDRTEIVGSGGRISYATFDTTPILLSTPDRTSELAIDNPPHIQQPLIQTIVDELNGVGRCPSTGESGARTSWVMDRMLDGYRPTLP